MAKSFEYDRFDVYGPGRIDPQGEGEWIKAQDAIDREKVNADRIRTLELQLKEARVVSKLEAGTWSTEKPTEPGYYWAARPGEPFAEVWEVKREFSYTGRMMVSLPRVDYLPLENVRHGVRWYGPIQAPDIPYWVGGSET